MTRIVVMPSSGFERLPIRKRSVGPTARLVVLSREKLLAIADR